MITLAIVITLLAIVQSLLGVGLLVFGTPTLLLMNYPFDEALSILLPCSMIVNLAQIFIDRKLLNKKLFKGTWILFPAIFIGLIIVFAFELKLKIRFFIGLMLLISAIIRFFPRVQAVLVNFLKRYSWAYLALMGMVHGLSNMGGALLTIFVSATQEDKRLTRVTTAFYYFCMAGVQLVTLVILKPELFSRQNLGLMSVALLAFLVVGNKFFALLSEKGFAQVATSLILGYGFLLILF